MKPKQFFSHLLFFCQSEVIQHWNPSWCVRLQSPLTTEHKEHQLDQSETPVHPQSPLIVFHLLLGLWTLSVQLFDPPIAASNRQLFKSTSASDPLTACIQLVHVMVFPVCSRSAICSGNTTLHHAKPVEHKPKFEPWAHYPNAAVEKTSRRKSIEKHGNKLSTNHVPCEVTGYTTVSRAGSVEIFLYMIQFCVHFFYHMFFLHTAF